MMKKYFVLFCLISISLCFQNCNKNSTVEGNDTPIFSYTESIVNPPDEFKIVFNTSWIGIREAIISFQEDNVWYVEKLGDGRIDIIFQNENENFSLLTSDSLALKGDTEYKIMLRTLYTSEYNNYFLAFTKTDLEYETFEPKI